MRNLEIIRTLGSGAAMGRNAPGFDIHPAASAHSKLYILNLEKEKRAYQSQIQEQEFLIQQHLDFIEAFQDGDDYDTLSERGRMQMSDRIAYEQREMKARMRDLDELNEKVRSIEIKQDETRLSIQELERKKDVVGKFQLDLVGKGLDVAEGLIQSGRNSQPEAEEREVWKPLPFPGEQVKPAWMKDGSRLKASVLDGVGQFGGGVQPDTRWTVTPPQRKQASVLDYYDESQQRRGLQVRGLSLGGRAEAHRFGDDEYKFGF